MYQKTGKLQINLFNLFFITQLVGVGSNNKPDSEVWLFDFYLLERVSALNSFIRSGKRREEMPHPHNEVHLTL